MREYFQHIVHANTPKNDKILKMEGQRIKTSQKNGKKT